jgi:rare lipoprotein A
MRGSDSIDATCEAARQAAGMRAFASANADSIQPERHMATSLFRTTSSSIVRRALVCMALSSCMTAAFAASDTKPAKAAKPTQAQQKQNARLDHSGKTRKGEASYYGRKFYKKKMADGTPMNPQSNAAASKTLPLGTKARVTNLENGKSDVVEIRDRGPYAKDRIVDVSPKTADKLDLKKDGTAPVEVKPLAVPQPDGSVKTNTDTH